MHSTRTAVVLVVAVMAVMQGKNYTSALDALKVSCHDRTVHELPIWNVKI
jgi:hypothetical protein